MEKEKGLAINEGSASAADGGGGSGGHAVNGGDDGRVHPVHQHDHPQLHPEELLGEKLRRGISLGKRGGTSTPVPTWKLELDGDPENISERLLKQHQRRQQRGAGVSARKLGANLWEIQDLLPAVGPMSTRGGGLRTRRRRDAGKDIDLGDLSPRTPRDRPQSAGSLRRHLALAQHNKLRDHNASEAVQPDSSSSFSSSMELAACNFAMTPASSVDLRGKLAESGYNLRTSTELLKVLNRIWSLEEQHASNMSLIKALQLELDHARARIQELIHERQADRREIDGLLKLIAEDKLARKGKERERIKAAVISVKNELDDERRLRKHSEDLHRKLAREFSELKSSYSKSLIELDRERKMRILLESLCDEFAKDVGEYEQEVRELKLKCEKDFHPRCDRLVVHISEAWLDERMQMKLAEARGDDNEVNTILDRLGCEVESFLQAKRDINGSVNGNKTQKITREDDRLLRQSLESLHLNGAVSAPRDAEDEDSLSSDLHCFELNMNVQDVGIGNFRSSRGKGAAEMEETRDSVSSKSKIGYFEKYNADALFSMQRESIGQNNMNKSECKMRIFDKVRGIHSHLKASSNRNTDHFDSSGPLASENYAGEEIEEVQDEWVNGMGFPDYAAHESAKVDSANFCKNIENSENTHNFSGDLFGVASPVQQWNVHHISPQIKTAESSSKIPQGVKENTLKAKLLEARLEGKHARLRATRAS